MNCGKPLNSTVLKKYNLTPVLNSIDEIKAFIKNNKNKKSCIIHIDTAMNRLGISYSDLLNKENIENFNKLNIKFIMTHLACAEDKNNNLNIKQLNELKKCNKVLSKILKKSIVTGP